jgi:hypothetical protein
MNAVRPCSQEMGERVGERAGGRVGGWVSTKAVPSTKKG